MAKRYWLMKTEPSVYSLDDLERDGSTSWDGVRNYRARNFMRDEMKVGDLVLFYHSQVKPMGVVGVAKVCKLAYPDSTAFDKKSKYYDPKSKQDDPAWWMVDVEFVEKFRDTVTLDEMKTHADLEGMPVIQRGQRLSVQPVSPEHFKIVRSLGKKKKAPVS